LCGGRFTQSAQRGFTQSPRSVTQSSQRLAEWLIVWWAVHAERAKGVHAKSAKCHAKSAEVGGVANCVAGGSRRARKGGHAKFAKCHAKSAEVGGVANCVAGGSRRARKGGSRKVREVCLCGLCVPSLRVLCVIPPVHLRPNYRTNITPPSRSTSNSCPQ